jgi:hypothetical protein
VRYLIRYVVCSIRDSTLDISQSYSDAKKSSEILHPSIDVGGRVKVKVNPAFQISSSKDVSDISTKTRFSLARLTT